MRITKAVVRARFERVAKILGWNIEAYRDGKAQIGAAVLDHAACYGGYRLNYIVNEDGGEDWMFGRMERRSGAEMVAYLAGLEDGATEAAKNSDRAALLDALKGLIFLRDNGNGLEGHYRAWSRARDVVAKAEG